jgi:hypothetical protein
MAMTCHISPYESFTNRPFDNIQPQEFRKQSYFPLNNCRNTHQKWKVQYEHQKDGHCAIRHFVRPHGDLWASAEFTGPSRRFDKQAGRDMRVGWGREVWEIFYHFLGVTTHCFPQHLAVLTYQGCRLLWGDCLYNVNVLVKNTTGRSFGSTSI